MRTAVYICTGNLYHFLMVSLKSLLKNSNAEKVYLLVEHDDVGFPLPKECEIIRIDSLPQYFKKSGPNYTNPWSHVILLRAAYHRILADVDKVLSLDVDTIVMQDISQLWEIDISDKLLAGARETTHLSRPGLPYYNAGVLMMNLERLRSSGRGDEVIETLNKKRWDYPEQSAFNAVCNGSFYELPPEYNAGKGTEPYGKPFIRHYMGEKARMEREAAFRLYRDMDWHEVRP